MHAVLTSKQIENIEFHRNQARLERTKSRVHASSEALHHALANYAEGLATNDPDVRGVMRDDVIRCIRDCAKARDEECEELKRVERESALHALRELQNEAGVGTPYTGQDETGIP